MFPLARQRLSHLVRENPKFNLATAALYIAQEEYPDLNVESYLNALDTMANEVRERLPSVSYPLRMIKVLNTYLYQDLGYEGNRQDYYDPRNSFLNQVLDRRLGIPITLSLVYLEIAQRLEFPMVGINFPGHFLIRPDRDEMDLYVDPFAQGEILFTQDCQARLTQLYGPTTELRPQFLAPVTPMQFLLRMLTNLKQIYLHQNQLTKCVAASERILMLAPDTHGERRDRGILYYQLGRWADARQDLNQYLSTNPQATDRSFIDQLLNRMGKGV